MPKPRSDAPRALVAKLGGSLWVTPDLAGWISAMRRWPHALTLVPGGGPFADAVRAAQPQMGFSDNAAHKMALLAMEQYALALADLFEGLTMVESPQEAARAHIARRIALWRPCAMVADAPDVAARWETTSDSLAAWYAHRAGASTLLLIKSVDVDARADLASRASSLASRGVVDADFARFSQGLDIRIAGPRALASAPSLFAQGAVPGAALTACSEGLCTS
jgi:aspartokinase-like uncharacterized kinase